MTDKPCLARALFNPRAVALIGASGDPDKNTGRPQRFLKAHGYRGTVYPVNPTRAEVQGARAYRSIADVPGPVDQAFIMTPADHVADAVKACGEKGVPVAAVYSDGFAETGAAGRARQAELTAAAGKAGVRILGPNAQGVICPASNLTLSVNAVLEMERLIPGKLSLVSQSGTILGALLSRGFSRGVGFARMISVGNQGDLTAGDIVDLMVEDEETEAVLLFLEGITDREKLAAASRRAFDAGKPVIALKLGRSSVGRDLAVSHSGAIAGADRAVDAFLEANGVARVDMLESLIEAPRLFIGRKPPAPGAGVAVVTTTGGGAAMVADQLGRLGVSLVPAPDAVRAALREKGLEIGRGPLVDLTMAGTRDGIYGTALKSLLDAPEVGAVAAVVGSSGQFHPRLAVSPIVEEAREASKPVAAFIVPQAEESLGMLEENGVPGFRTPESCADSLSAFLNWKAPTAPAKPSMNVSEAERRLESAAEPRLNEREAALVFEALGVPIAAAQIILEPHEPVTLGFPVAVKMLSRSIAHKSDRGLVELGVMSQEEIYESCERIHARLGGLDDTEGMLVQKMADGLFEVILGFRADPEAGPVVMVGPGGVHAELYGDVALRPAPLTKSQAMEMLKEARGLKPLFGYRGEEPGDTDALAETISAFSHLASLSGVVTEAEINPLMVMEEGGGVVAVDALLVRTAAAGSP